MKKYQYQPEHPSNDWLATLFEHGKRLRKACKESTSLKNHFLEVVEECYQDARQIAAIETELTIETFPNTSPFSKEPVLDSDFLPNS